MTLRHFGFAVALSMFAPAFAVGCSSDAEPSESSGDELRGAYSMIDLLSQVPPGTPWADVSPAIRAKLRWNAEAYYAKVRHDWGQRGLDEKEERLLEHPTAAMIANFDRLLKHVLSPDVPETFTPSTDILNPALRAQAWRFYLAYVASNRHWLLASNPEFKDWDGGDIVQIYAYVPSVNDALVAYVKDIEAKVGAIPAASLNDVEKALIAKAAFTTRAIRNNLFNYTGTAPDYLWDFISFYANPQTHLFKDDEDFLLALNAVTFERLAFTNKGTVDAFNWAFAGYLDPGLIGDYGLAPDGVAGKGYLTLAGWWSDRVNASSEAQKKCTVYTPFERKAIWDGFTARQRTNADGSETFEGYAASYEAKIAARLVDMKQVASNSIEAIFVGTGMLDASQKTQVLAAIQAETKPAAILETIYAALDSATGSTAASDALKADFASLEMIGGGYAEGEAPRVTDVTAVNAMWATVKAYLASHYGGLSVDIAALAPATVMITTTSGSGTYAAPPGVVSVGVGDPVNKATLFSTMLHEAKHAIDFASKAPVQGAAWEGAASLVEETVFPSFFAEVMTSPADVKKLPVYILADQIEAMRVAATTDATLKVFLRDSCSGASKPDTIEFAKGIVKSYGYTDDEYLLSRSQRAHLGPQYLDYEYGLVQYAGILSYLQGEIGSAKTLDPFVLQACGMASPAKSSASVTKLKTCLGLP